MAESSNSNSLIAQFEKSYSETMATLTQEDFVYDKSPETLKAELDTKITKFTDLARQMETFFLQKQFLVYAHKPELHLKDESTELRQEIQRKDEIVKKHNDKLANCLKMLQDAQQQQKTAVGPNMPLASPSSSSTTNLNSQTRPQKPAPPGSGPRMPGHNFPANQYRMGSPSGGASMASNTGPLAYLEKTTTNIK